MRAWMQLTGGVACALLGSSCGGATHEDGTPSSATGTRQDGGVGGRNGVSAGGNAGSVVAGVGGVAGNAGRVTVAGQAGSVAGQAGSTAAAGQGGSGGDRSIVDPVGDDDDPGLDVVSVQAFASGDWVDVRVQFAGAPEAPHLKVCVNDDPSATLSCEVTGTGSPGLFLSDLDHGPSTADLFIYQDTFWLRTSFDPCEYVSVDFETNTLRLLVPREFLSSDPDLQIAIASSSDRVPDGQDAWFGIEEVAAFPPFEGTGWCFGWNDEHYRQSSEQFEAIAVGSHHACGITVSGDTLCWGDPDVSSAIPTGTFTAIAAGVGYGCGLRSTGSVECWGYIDGGFTPPSDERLVSLSHTGTCGLREDGSALCWSLSDATSRLERSGPFIDVSGNLDHGCAIRGDGALECWGYPVQATDDWLSDDYQQVSVASLSACALTVDGRARCVFDQVPLTYLDPVGGPFVQLSAGANEACVITAAGEPVCFGSGFLILELPPGLSLTYVTAPSYVVCGILPDATVGCWSRDLSTVFNPP